MLSLMQKVSVKSTFPGSAEKSARFSDTPQGDDNDDLWLKSHMPTSSKELAMHSTRVKFIHQLAILCPELIGAAPMAH